MSSHTVKRPIVHLFLLLRTYGDILFKSSSKSNCNTKEFHVRCQRSPRATFHSAINTVSTAPLLAYKYLLLLASRISLFKPSKPVCFQFLTFHTWQTSRTLNAVIIWLMSKLFSISGNKYFWLIMTRGKGMKIYLGWISLITFVIFAVKKKY